MAKDKAEGEKNYGSEKITVLEGLEAVRKRFDIFEISECVKKKGDILEISKKLRIKPRVFNLAVEEARILSLFPNIHKSKVNSLSRLKTNRELEKFSNLYDVDNLGVRELYKKVRGWNYILQENPLKLLTQKEHDLLIGILLGDSSIRQRDRNCCFRVSHSLAQEDYIRWKSDILSSFDFSEFRKVKRKIRGKFTSFIDLSTKTHYVFNYYRNLFYKSGKKKVTDEILNEINPRSLAIWVCDNGSYNIKQEYLILCTYSFSLEEHELMKKFFNKKFGVNPTIGFRDNKYHYLRFKKEDTKKLIDIIRDFVPECMSYKVGGER